ncbi:MAG: MFS transporter [Sphingobium sp.]|uniref:MFS transporter n=1 Tax=Sphingobium sp. TaxID=1912891 RepID=UPI0029B00467|nr:MFS transporter [Sphingobium sp.]MDX3911627.1 MFS transporter [Sphingobium sp.]
MSQSLPSPPARQGLAVLAAVCLAALMLPLSFSTGAMATPAIGRSLGGSATMLTWITNAFMLSFGGLLMLAGAMSDQMGRKRMFLIGVGIFVGASLGLAIAPSLLFVDVLRAVQGVGAAAALSGGSAALAQEFDGQARTRAFSLLGTTFGVGLAFGPIVGGMIIELIGWRSIFLATSLIATVAFILGSAWMRESRASSVSALDWPGAMSFTATLTLFTFAVIQAPASGWGSAVVILCLGASLSALISFCWIETRSAHPMLDLSLFRYPRFVGVQLLPIATCYGFVVLLVLLPFRFMGIEGRSETATGLLMLAISGPMVVVPSIAATLTRWLSPGAISCFGLSVAAVGLLWLGQVPPGGDPVAALLLIGIGTGLPWGLMDGLSISVVPADRAGMAAGIFGTTRVAGEGLALALVTAAMALLVSRELERDLPSTSSTALSGVAQRLAAGDLNQAAAIVPGIDSTALVQIYADAFTTLTQGLAAVTLLSAALCFALLRAPSRRPGAGEWAVQE